MLLRLWAKMYSFYKETNTIIIIHRAHMRTAQHKLKVHALRISDVMQALMECKWRRRRGEVWAHGSLVPSPLPAAILQWPERWSGTFARYFDTALGALAKILASAFMSCDMQFSSFIRSPT